MLISWSLGEKGTPNWEAKSQNRFFDWQTLKYSLRSIEKHAPWLRKVHLVTNGQTPHWLNLNTSRVRVVTHDQIFLNKSVLPTFNSNAIELQLHRIPGLTDKFVYFNDDIMLTADVSPTGFCHGFNGQVVRKDGYTAGCAQDCPIKKQSDGKCQLACNVTSCGHDNGDCLGEKISIFKSPKGNDLWSNMLGRLFGNISFNFNVCKFQFLVIFLCGGRDY